MGFSNFNFFIQYSYHVTRHRKHISHSYSSRVKVISTLRYCCNLDVWLIQVLFSKRTCTWKVGKINSMSEHASCLLNLHALFCLFESLEINSLSVTTFLLVLLRFCVAFSKIWKMGFAREQQNYGPIFRWHLRLDISHLLRGVCKCLGNVLRLVPGKWELLLLYRNFNFEWARKVGIHYVCGSYI